MIKLNINIRTHFVYIIVSVYVQLQFLLIFFFFSSDMVVRSIGNSLMVILPDLLGKKITNWFDLVRPLIAFKFQTVRITNIVCHNI